MFRRTRQTSKGNLDSHSLDRGNYQVFAGKGFSGITIEELRLFFLVYIYLDVRNILLTGSQEQTFGGVC